MQCCLSLNTNEKAFDRNHKPKGQQEIYSHYKLYLFGVQPAYLPLHSSWCGYKDCLQANKASYKENSLDTYSGHTKTSSQCNDLWSHSENNRPRAIITKIAEKQAILPLGLIPGYKKDDLSYCHQVQLECKTYNWHTNNTQCNKININSPCSYYFKYVIVLIIQQPLH